MAVAVVGQVFFFEQVCVFFFAFFGEEECVFDAARSFKDVGVVGTRVTLADHVCGAELEFGR